jgi:hypothetical protein
MKSLFKLLFVLALSLTIFVSCKKEETKETKTTCDGKGYFHYSNSSNDRVRLTVDRVDYGMINSCKALEIPLRVGTFHYYVYGTNYYGDQTTLIKEGDVTIVECEAVYAS